jgi:outer membrane murein-binding lipoprotein Lpp
VKTRSLFAALVCGALLAGCSFQNKYESEAQKITEAVMHNDLGPVKNDLAPNVQITRVKVANWADELDAQGKLQSVKEVTPCNRSGYHCLTVKFDKGTYNEWIQMDDQNKVVNWYFHAAPNAG